MGSLKVIGSVNSLLILIAFFEVASCEIFFKKGAPFVKLANGALLSGTVKFSRDGRPFSSFVGIPYATVPERFSEPELSKEPAWDGVRSSVKPGSICAQKPVGPADVYLGEEDCLYANVFVPMNNTGKKGYSVMVWMHGGGFTAGDGLSWFKPNYFMDEDVILVTLNYRLGVFGFLSTGDEVIPGNNGLKDQVMALRWVQENIKNFNGNPNKVTIFGESAGAASVHYLVLSPQAKGLFHRAIAQSGSALAPWAHERNPKETAVKLATFLHCPTAAGDPSGISSEEILTCLRGKTTDELNRAQYQFKKSWPLNYFQLYFVPTTEPEVTPSSKHSPILTKSTWTLMNDKTRSLSDVPIMFGATEDEGAHMLASVVMNDPELLKEINANFDELIPYELQFDKVDQSPKTFKTVSKKIKDFYFKTGEITRDSNNKDMVNLYSDSLILQPVHRAATETALRGSKPPVYLFQFAYPCPVSLMAVVLGMENDPKIVGHGDELPFLFNMNRELPGIDVIVKEDSPDEEFSRQFVRLWTSFARHGEPKHSWGASDQLSKRWHPISKKELDGTQPLKWYRIDSNPKAHVIDDSTKERITLWNTIWDEINSENIKANAEGKTEL